MLRRNLPLLLLLGVSPAWSLGPEWAHIKAAEASLSAGDYLQADAALQKALAVNPEEPKIQEDMALVHLALGEYASARKRIREAIAISQKKAARFKAGTKGRAAWSKYLGELFSLQVEAVILENGPQLRGRLTGEGPRGPAKTYQASLEKVRVAVRQVAPYKTFTSRIDDPLVRKAFQAAAGGKLPEEGPVSRRRPPAQAAEPEPMEGAAASGAGEGADEGVDESAADAAVEAAKEEEPSGADEKAGASPSPFGPMSPIGGAAGGEEGAGDEGGGAAAGDDYSADAPTDE